MRLRLRRWILAAGTAALVGCEVAAVESLGGPGGQRTTGGSGAVDGGRPDGGAPPTARADAGARRDAGGAGDLGPSWDAAVPPPDAGVPSDILERLQGVPGLNLVEVAPQLPSTRAFLIEFTQPEDHSNPRGRRFRQRMVLVHQSDDAPLVLHTTGYGMYGDPLQFTWYITEPGAALGANVLTVEHRYFGTSIAPDADWRHLTVEQSANDSHRIVQAFARVYGGAVIATGTSKGGLTALLHQRYFPEDLAGVVAYVAPLTFGLEDPRYLPFVANIGPPDGACRRRVQDAAVELVERRAEAAQHLLLVDPDAPMFSQAALEAIAAYGALNFNWQFWQYYGSLDACFALPPRGAPIDQLVPWFGFTVGGFLSLGLFDPELSPYGFQVERELGGPAVDYTFLESAFAEVDFGALPELLVDPAPWPSPVSFDPVPILELDDFLQQEADRVIAVYGAFDPWTAGAVDLDPARDTLTFTAPTASHGAALGDLSDAEIDLALRRLYEWSGRRSLTALSAAALEPSRGRLRAAAEAHRAYVERARAYEQRVLRLR